MAEKTFHDLFIEELRDTYDAEKQLIKALPKMARAATSSKLRATFESHLRVTRGQVTRLEKAFASLNEKPRGKHCDGMAGIVKEGDSIIKEDLDGETRDAALIAAGQRAEHYEMAAYGTLVAWARIMGHTTRGAAAAAQSQRRRGRRPETVEPGRPGHQPEGVERGARRERRRRQSAGAQEGKQEALGARP